MEPLYSTQVKKESAALSPVGKSQLGRECYSPLTNTANPIYTVTALSDDPESGTEPRSKAPLQVSTTASRKDKSTGSSSIVQTRSLSCAEIVVSAYIHGILSHWSHMDEGDANGDRSNIMLSIGYWFLYLWQSLHGENWLLQAIETMRAPSAADTQLHTHDSTWRKQQSDKLQSSSWTRSGERTPPPRKRSQSVQRSAYVLALENHLLRNAVFHQLSMTHRYVAVCTVHLQSMRDISYKPHKDAFGFSLPPSKETEVMFVIRLQGAADKDVELLPERGGGGIAAGDATSVWTRPVAMRSTIQSGVNTLRSTLTASPLPAIGTLMQGGRGVAPPASSSSAPTPSKLVDAKHSVDAFETPYLKAVHGTRTL